MQSDILRCGGREIVVDLLFSFVFSRKNKVIFTDLTPAAHVISFKFIIIGTDTVHLHFTDETQVMMSVS